MIQGGIMTNKIIGAKWWKFDFHTHTPASFDYGKGTNQSELKKISHADWLLTYMRNEIDCVAITDHNSGAWIDQLKKEVENLKEHPDYRPLHLFPGVEISVNGGVHILAIFDIDKTQSDIDSLLGAVKYRGEKGNSDDCTASSATEVIDIISEHGAIPIPAHVNCPRGIFTEFQGTTLEQILANKNIYAIESTSLDYEKQEIIKSKKLAWTEVLGSDSHHLSGEPGMQYPGSHYTWVKMASPSLNGLKLALLDGNLSIKRSDSCTDNPNTHGSFIINSIEVENAKYLGRGKKLSCSFNPWLNTIVGGRGTGKSTLVEFLRLTLDRNNELPDSISQDFAKYSKPNQNRNDDGLLRDDSLITVSMTKDGIHFQSIWDQNQKTHIINKRVNDAWELSESNVAQRFPIRIYSQKQIFELAKNPHVLLNIIDDSPSINHQEWELEHDKHVNNFLTYCIKTNQLNAELKNKINLQRTLEDINQKLIILEESNHAVVLKEYSQSVAIENIIDQQLNLYKNFSLTLEKNINDIFIPQPIQLLDIGKVELNEFLNFDKSFQEELTSQKEQINTIISNIKVKIVALESKKEQWEITKLIKQNKSNYQLLTQELAEKGVKLSDEYESLLLKKNQLENKLQSIDIIQQEHTELEKLRLQSYKDMDAHRKIITERRKIFLNEILKNNPHVQIDILPYGNLENIESEFRALIGNTQSFERDIGKVDSEEGILASLKDSSNLEKTVCAIKKLITSLHKEEPTAIEQIKDKRFASYIASLSLEQISKILTWFPDDSLSISYKIDGNSQKFQSIEHGSPGQKTAALLAFILSYGDEPLILDQPEDDLDNYLIYDLIVQHLRNIKTKRQVIIVTHNANIVVNGDAENIIVLAIKAGSTQVITHGSLQEMSVREEICKIMEGGKEAFKKRYERIGMEFNEQ